jgi:hypothetical protein
MYPKWNFWSKNIPSGNPVPHSKKVTESTSHF